MNENRSMAKTNWARVYNAYFQEMVVKGLTAMALNTIGEDAGFAKVASIVERGAMIGFGILLEELSKAGVKPEKLDLKGLLEYEVKCHSFAAKEMNVGLQVFEEYRHEGENRHVLYTKNCIYKDIVRENPLVCAVCVGLVSGILKRFGLKVQWTKNVENVERAKLLCHKREEERPEYIVYRDASVKLPECKLVIEKLVCEQ